MLLFSLLTALPPDPPAWLLAVVFGLCVAGAVAFRPRKHRP